MALLKSGLLIFSLLTYATLAESVLKKPPHEGTQKLVFDSRRDRDRRFHDLYVDLQHSDLQEFDRRFAFTLQGDPLLGVQFVLSLYIVVNQIIEPLVSLELRSRLRLQNLISDIAKCVIDIGFRFHVPKDYADAPGIFAEDSLLSAAERDMKSIVKGREGQQIAYAIICLLSGTPAGCALPLILRGIPSTLKSLLLFAAAYSPQLTTLETKQSKKGAVGKVKRNILSRMLLVKRQVTTEEDKSEEESSSTGAEGDSSKSATAAATKQVGNSKGKATVTAGAYTRDAMQLLVEFACEVASLVLEVGMLVHVVCAKFLDFSNVKAGLFVVWFRLITTTMILQYLFVRITQSLTLFREAIAAVPVLNGLAPLLERIVSTAIGARGKLDELRSSLLSKRASPAISTKKQQQKKKSKKGVSSKHRTRAVGKSGDPTSGTSDATSSSSEISSDQEFVQEHSSEVDDSTDKLEEPAKEALKAGDTSTSTNQTRSPDSSHGSKAGGNLANTTAAGKSKKRETKNKKRNE
jgi:hypothetical protein